MPFTSRLAGSVVALVLALSSSPSLSQGAGQGSKPMQPAPQSQQAQPTNGGPVIVQLKPEPAQPDWTKVCEKNEGSKTEVCYTTRDFVTDKGQRIFAVAVYDAKGKKAHKTVRLLTPLVSLSLLGFGLRWTRAVGSAAAIRPASRTAALPRPR